jgi:hypothetical protein
LEKRTRSRSPPTLGCSCWRKVRPGKARSSGATGGGVPSGEIWRKSSGAEA